jgi:hypothetical protein
MQPLTWRDGSGAIVLLPERGRVLQVLVGGHHAFWTPQQAGDDWNVGGDRLWVSPEAAWFWKALERVDFEQYEIPSALDPGRWTLSRDSEGFCEMAQRVVLRHQHSKQLFSFDLARRFSRISLQEPPFAGCVAYHSENELRLGPGARLESPAQSIGLWSLLQVPVGGQMSVGVRPEAAWRDYFTPIQAPMWKLEAGALHLQISGSDQYKIGIAPRSLTGRAAYAREIGGEVLFILRQWEPQPWLSYCDAPLGQLDSEGDALQVYSDPGGAHSFGEMELHAPALRFGEGSNLSVASHFTVAGLAPGGDWNRWRDGWLAGEIVLR